MRLSSLFFSCFFIFSLYCPQFGWAKSNYSNGQTIMIVLGEDYFFDTKEYSSFNIQNKEIATVNRLGILKTRKEGLTGVSFKDHNGNHYRLNIRVIPQKVVNMCGEFPILAWYSLQEDLSKERFVELRDAGFNLSFSYATDSIVPQMERALRNARGSGVRLVVPFRGTWVDVGYIVNRFKDFDTLWGWYIMDEPSYDKMEDVSNFINDIRVYDEDHPFYVNLLPTYADSVSLGGSYTNYVAKYLECINPSFLSFDHYPITYKGLRKDFYYNLKIISSFASQRDIPFWSFACSTQYSGSVPPPLLAHLKLEVFTALAFGSQGIQYFTYTTPREIHGGKNFSHSPLDNRFNKTTTYYWVKEVNSRVRSLERFFMGAEVKTIGYFGEKGLEGISKYKKEDFPACIEALNSSETLLISRLITNTDKELFVIVNTNYERLVTVEIEHSNGLVKVARDGQFESVSPIEKIEPGEMLVYTF